MSTDEAELVFGGEYFAMGVPTRVDFTTGPAANDEGRGATLFGLHECPECGLGFFTAAGLAIHLSRRHSLTPSTAVLVGQLARAADVAHPCPDCGLGCASAAKLARHMAVACTRSPGRHVAAGKQ